MTTKNLLVELFVEELPPRALKKLGESFAGQLFEQLRSYGLTVAGSKVEMYASPRRLAAHVSNVLSRSADQPKTERLMPRAVAFDASGKPTPALLKKAQAISDRCVVLVKSGLGAESGTDRLYSIGEGKDAFVYFDTVNAGDDLPTALQFALKEILGKLPIPKLMSYQLADGLTSVNFVRPAHGLVALHGADVVEKVTALGLKAGRTTQGHRFEAVKPIIELRDADSYAAQLHDEGAVIASFAKRHGEIARQLHHVAAQEGLTPIEDAALLDEVTALVERPNVLLGRFDESFLALPQECLILTMKANQKYFPLLDAKGSLTNRFLIVSNIQPKNPTAVIRGNERVVRPRLADAKFFFDQDRKRTLESRLPGLDQVVYHGKLGSLGARVERVRAIAREIGLRLGGATLAAKADQAARLAKADLLTEMVGEFPELQGTMGRYYAQHDGLPEDVAWAIADHYRPRFAGDELPRNEVGVVLALADKLEILVGLFGIDQGPTGDKDPFALRRHALGVLRMLIEQNLPLRLSELLSAAFEVIDSEKIQRKIWDKDQEAERARRAHESGGAMDVDAGAFSKRPLDPETPRKVADFLFDRMVGMLRDEGHSTQEVDAVLSLKPDRLGEILLRLNAVRDFVQLPEAAALAAANKRIVNILKKTAGDVAPNFDASLLREPAEVTLAQALAAVKPDADTAFGRADYAASLKSLARLKLPVDAFFDTVMVNVEDAALRANRLGLLASLRSVMNRVADLSKLAVQT